MKLYRVLSVLCIICVLVVFAASCYWLYKNIVAYFDKVDVIEHKVYYYEGSDEIETAVSVSGEEGSPYKIEGVLGFFNGYDESSETLSLLIINVNEIDATMLYISNSYSDKQYDITDDVYLPTTYGVPEYREYNIEDVDESFLSDLSEIYLSYMYDDNIIHTVNISPYTKYDYSVFNSTDVRTNNNIDDFSFIMIEEENLFFIGEEIVIDKPMYIPEEYTLNILPGQKIDIINSGYITVRSNVIAIGTDDSIIEITSSDGTGGGIVILQASEISDFSNVKFSNLVNIESGVWILDGALNFYESEVNITNCEFYDSLSNDYINAIRSEISINKCTFINIYKDAVDIDYGTCSITDVLMENIGDDGISASGSDITVYDSDIIQAADKAINISEDTQADIRDVSISLCNVGMAVTDSSSLEAENIEIEGGAVGIVLFCSSNCYVEPYANMSNIDFNENLGMDYLMQKDCVLYIDGECMYSRSDTKESLLFDKIANGEPLT